jgi:hypothetical protein
MLKSLKLRDFFLLFGIVFEINLYICFNQVELMTKNYFYIILFFLCLSTTSALAQDGKQQSKVQETTIEGLSIYPNPTTGDRIYISTKLNDDKQISIFDVLGKKVLQTTLSSKELNISSLTPGVYIIKIEEGDASATRKLIVR